MQQGINHQEIRLAVRYRYAQASRCVDGMFGYPTGRAGAEGLGYLQSLIEEAPKAMIDRFCGVGNPFSLGVPQSGDTVLDLGCGAGFDLFCAATLTGPSGRAFGIDLTPAMAESARRNFDLAGCANVVVRTGCVEEIPFDEGTFDLVISNGVLNLSPDKERCFSDIGRVLRPGGRLQFADIVLEEGVPTQSVSAASWSN